MRKLILSVLLAASVAVPAMAQEDSSERGSQDASSAERAAARAARRAERVERVERVERERPQDLHSGDQNARVEARRQRAQAQDGQRRGWGQRRSNNDGMTAAIERQQATGRAFEQHRSSEGLREHRRDGRNRDGSVIERVIDRTRTGQGQVVVNRDQDVQSRSRYSGTDRRWSNHWRGDRNYNWRNYRHRNRSIYRLGNYWDPYGSRYRRFSIGFNLFPSYYRSNYWLSDPWQYRLPPAYGPYRWVRYYNDALLVDIYNGQVVDVEHNFFW